MNARRPPPAAALLLLVLLLASCGAPPPPARVAAPAPELAALDLDDHVVRLADLRGRVVLLNFWFSGCGPCLAEMPQIEALHRAHQAAGLSVVALNMGQDKNTIRAALRRLSLSLPVAADPLMISARKYEVEGAPVSFLIDRAGIVRERIDGVLPKDIEARLSALLAEGTPSG